LNEIRAVERLWGPAHMRRAHAVVFLLAFLVRLAFQGLAVGFESAPRDDAGQYDSIAWSLAQGGPYVADDGYRSHRAPGYTYLLAGTYAIAGHSWTAGRVVQALTGALACSLLLGLGAATVGPAIGLFAALACAVFPYAIFFCGFLLTEPLCTLLTVAATYALWRARTGLAWCAIWSFLCALAALTRPPMALLFALGIVVLVLRGEARFKRLVLATAIFSLTLLPWTIRNYAVHHRLVAVTTMGGWVLWEGNNPVAAADPDLRGRAIHPPSADDGAPAGLPEAEQDAYYFRAALHFMRTHASDMPGLMGRKLARVFNLFPQLESRAHRWIARLTLLPVLVFAVAGVVVAIARREAWLHMLLVPVAAVTVTGVVYWADARIRAPADPCIMLLAAYGCAAMGSRLSRFFKKPASPQP
jgi:hypothetical protein